MMEINIQRVDKGVEMPCYAHEGDAAFDLRSAEEVLLKPGEKHVVKTGIKMAIPKGYFGNIRDRSGMAAKQGVHCLAGVVDAGYRGEVGVVMVNLGKEDVSIEKNMRIAQMLIQKAEAPKIIEVDELEETTRGEGGFGSTGAK